MALIIRNFYRPSITKMVHLVNIHLVLKLMNNCQILWIKAIKIHMWYMKPQIPMAHWTIPNSQVHWHSQVLWFLRVPWMTFTSNWTNKIVKFYNIALFLKNKPKWCFNKTLYCNSNKIRFSGARKNNCSNLRHQFWEWVNRCLEHTPKRDLIITSMCSYKNSN